MNPKKKQKIFKVTMKLEIFKMDMDFSGLERGGKSGIGRKESKKKDTKA